MRLLSTTAALLIALSLGWASNASAQSSDTKIEASVEGAFVLPLGDWADASGPGLGVIARADIQLQAKLKASARVGYVFHIPKDQNGVDTSTSELLFLGGVMYDLGPVILDAATGFNSWTFKVDGGGFRGDDTETRIALWAGAKVPLGKVEVGANLFVPNLLLTKDEEDTQLGLMATVGYRFL